MLIAMPTCYHDWTRCATDRGTDEGDAAASAMCHAERHTEALQELRIVLGPDVEDAAPLRTEARRLVRACEEAIETEKEDVDSTVRTISPSPTPASAANTRTRRACEGTQAPRTQVPAPDVTQEVASSFA